MTRKLALPALLAASCALGGCWFVYIPGSAISGAADALSGNTGNLCVSESAKLGDRIRMPSGEIGTVKKLEGPSGRCTKPETPIRAVVLAE